MSPTIIFIDLIGKKKIAAKYQPTHNLSTKERNKFKIETRKSNGQTKTTKKRGKKCAKLKLHPFNYAGGRVHDVRFVLWSMKNLRPDAWSNASSQPYGSFPLSARCCVVETALLLLAFVTGPWSVALAFAVCVGAGVWVAATAAVIDAVGSVEGAFGCGIG